MKGLIGDDMYLLRLIAQTGPVLKNLKAETARSVLKRLNRIVRANILQTFALEWIEGSIKSGLFESMP